MPAIYAHYKFGKECVPLFDARAKRVAKVHASMFRLGLQGPDFYFFDQLFRARGKKLSEIGTALHHGSCAALLENFEREGARRLDHASLAYILGLIGHFSLDSTCHPVIDAMVDVLDYDHLKLETEFDRWLLERDGEDARRYPLGDLVAADKHTRLAIGRLYKGLGTPEEVAQLFVDFGRIKNIARTPNDRRYKVYHALLKAVGAWASVGGIFMGPPDAVAAVTNARLRDLFAEAKPLYARLVANYMDHYEWGAPLDAYFQRDFETSPQGGALWQ